MEPRDSLPFTETFYSISRSNYWLKSYFICPLKSRCGFPDEDLGKYVQSNFHLSFFHGSVLMTFLSGVPKLNRSELVAACEDFSNIIGCFSDGNIYKGTLSSGVEIAVTCITSTSAGDWSKHLEAQFRKKV